MWQGISLSLKLLKSFIHVLIVGFFSAKSVSRNFHPYPEEYDDILKFVLNISLFNSIMILIFFRYGMSYVHGIDVLQNISTVAIFG